MAVPFKSIGSLACATLLALGASACATAVSTSGFNGEAKQVAQTIKNLQSDVTAGEQKKVCQNDLAASVVKRLSSASGGCQQAIKDQLTEIASFEVTIDSIKVSGTTATAQVKSKYSGKMRASTLTLVKEGDKWKISAVS
jgi:hypothetical protein